MKNKQFLLKSLLSTAFIFGGFELMAADSVAKTFQDEDGSSVEIKADGTKIIKKKDGTTVQVNLDGSKIIKDADGTSVQIEADGSRTIKKPDGTSIQVKPAQNVSK